MLPHKEPTTASVYASATASVEFSRNGRARQGCADVKNPERYLRNPANPYFVKTVTKRNDVLYVAKWAIVKHNLKFGAANSPMSYLLPNDKKMKGWTKLSAGGRSPCFYGWEQLCRKYNLKMGDSVVCELERSGGLVTAVRVHFVNQVQLEKDYEYYLDHPYKTIDNPEQYLDNPNNICFETSLKLRKYELAVGAQFVKDYCLKFGDYVDYIDRHGKLTAEVMIWGGQRVRVNKWNIICERNNLTENDGILCEVLRHDDKVVYAIRIHIIRDGAALA